MDAIISRDDPGVTLLNHVYHMYKDNYQLKHNVGATKKHCETKSIVLYILENAQQCIYLDAHTLIGENPQLGHIKDHSEKQYILPF